MLAEDLRNREKACFDRNMERDLFLIVKNDGIGAVLQEKIRASGVIVTCAKMERSVATLWYLLVDNLRNDASLRKNDQGLLQHLISAHFGRPINHILALVIPFWRREKNSGDGQEKGIKQEKERERGQDRDKPEIKSSGFEREEEKSRNRRKLPSRVY